MSDEATSDAVPITDAGRWAFVRANWGNVQINWHRDQSLKSISLTIKNVRPSGGNAQEIEREIDAAIRAFRATGAHHV